MFLPQEGKAERHGHFICLKLQKNYKTIGFFVFSLFPSKIIIKVIIPTRKKI